MNRRDFVKLALGAGVAAAALPPLLDHFFPGGAATRPIAATSTDILTIADLIAAKRAIRDMPAKPFVLVMNQREIEFFERHSMLPLVGAEVYFSEYVPEGDAFRLQYLNEFPSPTHDPLPPKEV